MRERAASPRPRAAAVPRLRRSSPSGDVWPVSFTTARCRASVPSGRRFDDYAPCPATCQDELSAGLQALPTTWALVYDELRQATGDLHQPAPRRQRPDSHPGTYPHQPRAQGRAGDRVVHRHRSTLRGTRPHDPGATYPDLPGHPGQRAAAFRARRVRVDIRVNGDGTQVQIDDDGVGFQPGQVPEHPTEHYGLAMMRERAESLGGRVEVTSAPAQGTCLRVWVPPLPAS